jgi:hypothetical protein
LEEDEMGKRPAGGSKKKLKVKKESLRKGALQDQEVGGMAGGAARTSVLCPTALCPSEFCSTSVVLG